MSKVSSLITLLSKVDIVESFTTRFQWEFFLRVENEPGAIFLQVVIFGISCLFRGTRAGERWAQVDRRSSKGLDSDPFRPQDWPQRRCGCNREILAMRHDAAALSRSWTDSLRVPKYMCVSTSSRKINVRNERGSTLTKVSDSNSFRTNPKFSESFRNLYLHQPVSFRSNPKTFFNPNQSDTHSKSIRTCNPNESGLSESIQMIPKNSDWFWMGLGLIWIEKCLRIRLEWNDLVWIQITKWFGKFQSELVIRMNSNNPN